MGGGTDLCLGVTAPPATAWETRCSWARRAKEKSSSSTSCQRERTNMWTSRISGEKAGWGRSALVVSFHSLNVALQVFCRNMERKWTLSWQQSWTVAVLWPWTSRYLCYRVGKYSFSLIILNIKVYLLPSAPAWGAIRVLTRSFTLVFKNWTWARRLSFTWIHPRSNFGLMLWSETCTQKPNTR